VTEQITPASMLSILRLALVPALLILAAGRHQAAYAVILGIAFGTDVADGYLARNRGQVSVLEEEPGAGGSSQTLRQLL
jgi:phosphatidylglycerophosphate synthase